MATITPLLTTLSNADTTTGWNIATTDSQNNIQSTACMASRQNSTTNGFFYTTSSVNMTTNDRHFYAWVLAAGASTLTSRANGGIQLVMGTSTTDYYQWYVAGNDTYTGGWKCFVINPNDDPDATTGTPGALSATTMFGVIINCSVKFSGNNLTIFVDAIRYGTGLNWTGANGGSYTNQGFEEIYQADNSSNNKYGVIDKIGGVYFLQGELTFGSTAGSTRPDFTDINSTVVFKDERVSNTLYKLDLVGHASDTKNSFQLGAPVGSGASTIGSQGVSVFATGSYTSSGSYTYVSGSPATITRSAGNFKTDGLKGGMLLEITGTSNNNKNVMCTKVANTTVTLASGETLINEGPVSSTLTASRRWDFSADDANIDELYLYGSTLKQAGNIALGSSSTALAATTLEIVDTNFSDTRQVFRNITTSSPLYIRSSINFNTNLTASLDMYDETNTDTDEWAIVQGPGFISTLSGTQTLNVSNHNYNVMTKPYITIQAASETWNSINPTWTITDQTELDFLGTAQGQVNEKYELSGTVQEPSGTAVVGAETYLYEASPTPALPTANQVESISGGVANSEVLRREYTAATPSSALTTVTHSTFAWKVYEYGYLPFVSAITIDSAVSITAIMLDDTYQVEGTASTARTLGDVTNTVSIEQQTNPATLLKYTGGSGTLSVGQTVANNSNGATGVVVEILEGDSTAGTILMDSRNATAWPTVAHTLDNGGGGWTATFTSGTIRSFTWLIDADSLTMQELYDYLNAKLAEDTLDTASPSFMDDVIMWGRAEHGIPVQGFALGSPNTFKTVRNVAQTEGWAVYNTDLGGVNVFTANDGTTFAPAATVTLEINGVSAGTRCYIEAASGGPETAGTVLMSEEANNSGVAQESYSYTTPQPVIVRARLIGYLPFETSGTITSSGLTVTAVWQVDPIADKIDTSGFG